MLGLSLTCAQASTVTYTVAGEAQAVITTGNGIISLTLSDFVVNPGDVTSNLSAFSFTLSSAPSSESISSSSAILRTVNSGGSYSDGASVAPGWTLSRVGAVTSLDDLSGSGHAGPAHTIIGAPNASNLYAAANGSMAGNGAHNPFLDQSATWTFAAGGVTSDTTVTAATFQFGTTDGQDLATGVAVATPEPASSALMLGAAGFGAAILRRRFRSSRSEVNA
jgi:hypothetical protein